MSELSDMERGDLEEAYSLCAVTLANREAKNAELRQQRDAMLAACKAALDTWGNEAMYPLTTAKIKAAIALAEATA